MNVDIQQVYTGSGGLPSAKGYVLQLEQSREICSLCELTDGQHDIVGDLCAHETAEHHQLGVDLLGEEEQKVVCVCWEVDPLESRQQSSL